MVDLHLHTSFSFDSRESAENYVKKAQECGLNILGFSEHYDYDAVLDGEDILPCDIKSYLKNAGNLSEKYEDMRILRGIEFGYRREALPYYEKLLSQYRFDYVINSLHTLKGKGDCYHDRFFEGKEVKDCYRDYLQGVLESIVCFPDYDIVGHIGYASRYRRGENVKLCLEDFSELLDDILREIFLRGKFLEINTSVGTSGSNFLPDESIIERYISLGGRNLTFGSDAHKAADYLRNYQKARKFLLEKGIERLYYFIDRKPVAYKI